MSETVTKLEAVENEELKVIIEAQVRRVLPEMKFSSKCFEVLNEKVLNLIWQAAKRCEANKRNTLMPQDF